MAKSKKKNVKKTKKKEEIINNNNSEFYDKILNIAMVVLIIILIFSLFYLLTVYITNKNSDDSDNSKDKDNTEETVSYTDIIVGRSFNIDNGEYLVIYYDKSDEENASNYTNLISEYKGQENHLNVYVVDMSNGINKKYAKDTSNPNPSNASEIAINGPTLIKFNDGVVEDYIEGYEAIEDYLK